MLLKFSVSVSYQKIFARFLFNNLVRTDIGDIFIKKKYLYRIGISTYNCFLQNTNSR